jgi:putative ABC transport system permease protein
MKVPLAWLQLSRERTRLLVAIAGIAFADILMFMQLGFREALFDSAVTLHQRLQGDIFLISPQSTALLSMKGFPSRRLYQALGFEGVRSISPIYLDFSLWKNPDTRGTRRILVVGFNPSDRVLNLPGVQQNLDAIKLPDVVLFDAASRPEFGPIARQFEGGGAVVTEVGNRRIQVGGLFTLGTSFGSDGTIVTSDLNFLRLFPQRNRGIIEIGAIDLEPGTNPATVIKSLKQQLPKDVRILSKAEYIAFEKQYWQNRTPIGYIFSLGTAMGFIVGTVIVYQILYTNVSDRLTEYATLKAMGYKSSYLLLVVFQEALILAVLGYLPGYGLSLGLYALAQNATRLPIAMSLMRAVTVLILTMLMCCISGAIAVQKLEAADPADIF